MTSEAKPRVVAIVVTFHPDLDVLDILLTRLAPQVTDIILVDNGSSCDLAAWNAQREPAVAELISLGENHGIAAAQNVGIQWARSHEAEFVLLMDQDSLPATNMVEKLLAAVSVQPSAAAVGPQYWDKSQNTPAPFIRVQHLTLKRYTCSTEDALVPADYLVSSGCLIPMPVLDKIGGMREELFIDYVDIEWGLRAGQFGFQSYGVCSAQMQHSMGDGSIKFLNKNIPLHSPLRHYYHFRNAILLYKESWMPTNWKLVDGWRLFLKYIFYLLFAEPRMIRWRMMSLGVWHGLVGKSGKLKGVSYEIPVSVAPDKQSIESLK
ncbi:MAG: glycosyltransferase family 2 protein [Methylobacter sp.]